MESGRIMAIRIDQDQKLITLHTKNTTYQMAVGAYGQLLHLYYGPRLGGDMRYLLTYYDRGFSGNPYEADCDKTYSMDVLPQEYPCFGNGDFRSPAFILKNSDGSYCADLRLSVLKYSMEHPLPIRPARSVPMCRQFRTIRPEE